jgi:hypothetical protein
MDRLQAFMPKLKESNEQLLYDIELGKDVNLEVVEAGNQHIEMACCMILTEEFRFRCFRCS